jgi:hypothetical protein
MKTTTLHLTLALLAGVAVAQEAPRGKGHRPPPPPPILAIFDTDKDGIISAGEIEGAAAALATLDKNNDGEITREELRPPRPQRPEDEKGPPPARRPPPLIAALDADKDGTLSAEELKGAPEALLELDENGDGELSPQELFPHGPPPPPRDRPDGEPDETEKPE